MRSLPQLDSADVQTLEYSLVQMTADTMEEDMARLHKQSNLRAFASFCLLSPCCCRIRDPEVRPIAADVCGTHLHALKAAPGSTPNVRHRVLASVGGPTPSVVRAPMSCSVVFD